MLAAAAAPAAATRCLDELAANGSVALVDSISVEARNVRRGESGVVCGWRSGATRKGSQTRFQTFRIVTV